MLLSILENFKLKLGRINTFVVRDNRHEVIVYGEGNMIPFPTNSHFMPRLKNVALVIHFIVTLITIGANCDQGGLQILIDNNGDYGGPQNVVSTGSRLALVASQSQI